MSDGGIDAVFARSDAIADAVLWEGYVLYPYRRSAAKNRMRFQWGVVGPAEESTMTATVLVDATAATVHVRVRFLHLHRRDDGWDEAVAVHRDAEVAVQAGTTSFPIAVDGGNGADQIVGRLDGQCVLDGALARLSVTVVNQADLDPDASRDDALLRSMVGCHLLFAATSDVFASLLEPADDEVAAAASRCVQHRCWPVLVGPAPHRDLVLASPVILYDFPAVSPESVGDFFDGTEIDEMLTLRVQTMTDDEKAEARATDPRAAAIIDRCETISEGEMASLHGVLHGAAGVDDVVDPLDPAPEWSDPGPAAVRVGDALVARGSRVVLHPRRRADAHDIFLRDRVATVAEIVNDVDGAVHLAVTIDDDPGADLWQWQRRYLYFGPDEVEVLAEGAGHG